MKQPITLCAIAALSFALLGGCASAPRNDVQVGPATTVEVENQSFFDMTVYVFEGGRRVRLGTVPGLATRIYTIPERLLFGISALRFQIDPLGGDRSPLTHEVGVAQGESLRLVIPPR
jgi:hypothetical protein